MNTHLRPQPAPLSAPPRAVPGRPGLAAADPGRVTRGLLLTQIPSVDWRIISRCNLACGFGYGLEPTRDPVRRAPGGHRGAVQELSEPGGVEAGCLGRLRNLPRLGRSKSARRSGPGKSIFGQSIRLRSQACCPLPSARSRKTSASSCGGSPSPSSRPTTSSAPRARSSAGRRIGSWPTSASSASAFPRSTAGPGHLTR